ncbi:MAG: hypothetical protein ACYCTL_03050 [Acidimicrobiales bacterium]
MRPYRFRLESLLRLRRAQEQAARYALAAANAAVGSTGSVLAYRQAAYEVLPRSSGSVPMDDFRREETESVLAAQSLLGARSRYMRAVEESSRRQEAWMRSRMAVTVLDRLDARRRSEHRLEEQREETKATDDVVGARLVGKAVALGNAHSNGNGNGSGNGSSDLHNHPASYRSGTGR